MIKSMLVRFAPWVILAGGLYAGATYVQVLNNERDALQADLEQSQQQAEVWHEQYAWQREQTERLVDTLDRRNDQLASIRDDINESREALANLGMQNEQIKKWLAGDVPTGVVEWLRALQAGKRVAGDAELPDDPGTANEPD